MSGQLGKAAGARPGRQAGLKASPRPVLGLECPFLARTRDREAKLGGRRAAHEPLFPLQSIEKNL